MHTKYSNTKEYAQIVSSNLPIPPTSKLHGRWMVHTK